jgi:hypothetical protein
MIRLRHIGAIASNTCFSIEWLQGTNTIAVAGILYMWFQIRNVGGVTSIGRMCRGGFLRLGDNRPKIDCLTVVCLLWQKMLSNNCMYDESEQHTRRIAFFCVCIYKNAMFFKWFQCIVLTPKSWLYVWRLVAKTLSDRRRQLTPNLGRIFGPRAVPEIPESRLFVFACKRRFVPACASLNRGFRGLTTGLGNVIIMVMKSMRRQLIPIFERISQKCKPWVGPAWAPMTWRCVVSD